MASDICVCTQMCAPVCTLAHTHSLLHTYQGGIQRSLYISLLLSYLGSDLFSHVVWQLHSCSVGQKEREASSHLDQIRGRRNCTGFCHPAARMSLPKVIILAFSLSGTALLSLGLFLSQGSVKNFLLPRF